ncbi:MAG: hypothetical protein RI973_88 [Bacteroidota bacterium]|jgi:hypothetical protein
MPSRILFLLLFNSCFTPSIWSQQEVSLNFLRQAWQANKINPAIVQPYGLVLGDVGLRTSESFDGPTYNQIVTRQQGKPVIQVERFINQLDPVNTVRSDIEFSTFSAAYRLGKATISLGHALRYHGFVQFPKTLPQLVWQGNAQFIGESVNLGNELQLTGYHELAAGLALETGPLTLGVRGKLLSGISNASTDETYRSATLYTDPDVYQITLDGNYVLHTNNTLRYENYSDLDANFDIGRLTFDRFFSQNRGFALDLGARLQLGKADLALSVIDLGKINWDNEVVNYRATQTWLYDGLDFSGALTGEGVSFDDALDTLEQLFQVEKTADSYSISLPRKVNFSALWQFNTTWRAGIAFVQENFRRASYNALAAGLNARLIPALDLGVSYAIMENRSYDNVGLNFTLKLGPLQLYGMTDNVISLLKPGDANFFTAGLGAVVLLHPQE